ncbi:MAG: DNA repair protein RecN [Roseburia sp.]|nr:DNA repair protein RecN [Anaeroplasma bactoclasticum]MCM1196900.1 DNA repair protein RecN [Roseburia sp.]MCM1556711.1 DNA repair protein RecN [Anaeroplasma bactoclasticum]
MLKSLSVRNFAIIEDIHIDFKEGMTVLTGETGAGKSLIIDTISLLLGQRADNDMIRYGEKKATIMGVFSYKNAELDGLLTRFSIPKESELTIIREIQDNGKNSIKLNEVSISLTMLKQISNFLADIHIQNDTFKLLNQDSYLSLICPNQDASYDKIVSNYMIAYSKYLDAYHKYEHVVKGQRESQDRLEYMVYEQAELKNLGLVPHIDETLASEISKLENYDKIFSNLNEAYTNLENNYFSIDSIFEAANHLKKISDLDPSYQEAYEKALDCYYILDEIKGNLSTQIGRLDFDQEELNAKIEQLNTIEKAKSKYKKSVEELSDYLNQITLQIDMVNNYEDVLKQAKDEVIFTHKNLVDKAVKLSSYRKKIAKELETAILKECHDLDLEDTRFEIYFSDVSLADPFQAGVFMENGIDSIDFMISFNRGEPLKSLHKVASGGEMSRIMLAFKSFFARKSNLSLMVFDEIDTGVSGAIAKKIALKMQAISTYNQVLCITHLPQVAAMGDSHIHIYKEIVQDRTTTRYKYLTFDERVEEVALMLSGDKLSLYALEAAKAMLGK